MIKDADSRRAMSNRLNSDHDPDAVSLRCSTTRCSIKTLRNNARIVIGVSNQGIIHGRDMVDGGRIRSVTPAGLTSKFTTRYILPSSG